MPLTPFYSPPYPPAAGPSGVNKISPEDLALLGQAWDNRQPILPPPNPALKDAFAPQQNAQDAAAFLSPPAAVSPVTPKTPSVPAEFSKPDPREISKYDFSPRFDQAPVDAELAQLQAASQQSIANQQRGADENAASLNAYRQIPMQLDLSPLAALADSWYGGNLQKGYARPENIQDKVGLLNQLQNALQKARGGVTQEQTQYLKDMLAHKDRVNNTKANLMMAQAKLNEAKNAKTAYDGMKEDKMTMQAREAYNKEFGNSINGMGQFMTSLRQVKDIIEKKGGIPQWGDDKALYDSAVASMIVRYNADVAKLGALAGGDLNLLTKAVGNNPEMIRNWLQTKSAGGGSGIIKILNNMEKESDRIVENVGTRSKNIWGKRVEDLYANDNKIYRATKGTASVTDDPATWSQEKVDAEYAKQKGLSH